MYFSAKYTALGLRILVYLTNHLNHFILDILWTDVRDFIELILLGFWDLRNFFFFFLVLRYRETEHAKILIPRRDTQSMQLRPSRSIFAQGILAALYFHLCDSFIGGAN